MSEILATYTYNELPDGTYSITCNNKTECTKAEIPSTYEGQPVTVIGNRAFVNCTTLKSVIIPDGIIKIDSLAFYGCNSLTGIKIPDSVISIGENAFRYCKVLTSAIIGDNVINIDSYAFNSCTSLTSVIIGNSVTTVGESVFSGCPIEKATIPAFIAPYINDSAINEITCVGSLLIILIGTNLMGITKVKVADFLPAIIYAPLIYYLSNFVIGLLSNI
jgi:hypothetical protein